MRKESLPHHNSAKYNERMRQQIAELEELDYDIKAFRIDALQNKGIQQAMSAIGSLDFSQLFER